MLNTYLLVPFSKAYRTIPTDDHHIADEIMLTLRQRVGLRLIHLGHQLRGEERLAA